MQNFAFESKFQKFYIIRIIQILQDKTLKAALREIKTYSIKQSTIEKFKIRKPIQSVFQGEEYISTKYFDKLITTLPHSKSIINLDEQIKKKIGSNPQQISTVKDTVSFIWEKNRQKQQELQTQRVIQNFLNQRSIRGMGQIVKSDTTIKTENQGVSHHMTIKLLLLMFFFTFLLYTISLCDFISV